MKLSSALGFLISAAVVVVACGDDDDGVPVSTADAGADTGATTETPADAGKDAALVVTNDCTAATAGLAQTADANAPVLDAAKSNLVQIVGTDALCASKDSGKHPGFGPVPYQLSIESTDADGDGPTFDDVSKTDVVRLASDPDIAISTRTDPAHFGTGGTAIIIHLCLDKVYGASELAIGFDIKDKAGHRSKAICIRQQSGG